MFCLLLLGCSTPNKRASSTGHFLSGTPSCTTCTIALDTVVTLRAVGSVLFGESSAIARGSDGGWLVTSSSRNEILAFDSNGRQRGVWGRDGDGPGELRGIDALLGAEARRGLAIQQGRIDAFDGDGKWLFRLPSRYACQLSMPAARLICVARSRKATGDSTGRPFLVLDSTGAVQRQFGPLPVASSRCGLCESYLAWDKDSAGVWAVGVRTYAIEHWTLDGRVLNQIAGVEATWFWGPDGPELGTVDPAATPRKPLGRIWGVLVAPEQRLWVLGSAPIPGQDRVGQLPSKPSATFDQTTAGYGSVVELVDPEHGVVASRFFPGERLMPLQPSLLFRARYDASDFVVIDVLRPRVVSP
jgi:hypothetical protein